MNNNDTIERNEVDLLWVMAELALITGEDITRHKAVKFLEQNEIVPKPKRFKQRVKYSHKLVQNALLRMRLELINIEAEN